MKTPLILGALLGGALFHPLQAAPAQSAAAPQTDFGAAQTTWADVRGQTRELDALIAARQLKHVHDAALGLRDTVRELRFGWAALSPPQEAKADEVIRKIDGLLDSLHEYADHNNPRGVVKDQRTLHLLLDGIAGAFPAQTLQSVGPIVATKAVKDPMCRMTVDPATAAARVAHGGQTYYFCAKSEAETFKKNPAPHVTLWDEISFGKPRTFTVSVAPTTGRVEAHREAGLVFAIREQGQSAPTRGFQLVHEKKFHLIAVSDDLGWFGHLHPEQARDGRFYLRQTFPREGRYFLYSDFTPASGANTIARSEIRVGRGVTRAPQPLMPDTRLSKVVDGVRVDLKLSAPLQAGKQTLLTYTLSKGGQPITSMTPYLAAMGHMMAISQGGQHALHTHTVSAGSDPLTGLAVTPPMATAKGPSQSFKLELPSGGLYKIWAQFGVEGRIVTVPFTFNVKKNTTQGQPNTMKITKPLAALAAGVALSGSSLPSSAAPAKAPRIAQRITVTLPQDYKSGVATVKAGKPVALTFYLKNDAGCGNEISLPAARWMKRLKVGERATVVYTPNKSGPLLFQCSMGHMKGTFTVK